MHRTSRPTLFRPRRRRAALALALLLVPGAAACGDDPNDAPGGSAPTTSPSAGTPAPTAPEGRDSSEDEGHPTLPGEVETSGSGG